MKDKSFEIKPNYLELAYHMDQIQIRQPKIPAAQSFIQILGTFLATLFIFLAPCFFDMKNSLFNQETAKTIGNTRSSLKKSNYIYQWENCQRVMKLRI